MLENFVKKIILEGCNGDWAQNHYLPFLVKETAKGDVELWAVGIEDEIKLRTPEVEKNWQVTQSKNRAHYLNKNKDTQTYNELAGINYVFIVTPDHTHCRIAKWWLDRLAPEGKIFIEKSLDASVEAARKLKEDIEKREKGGAVFGFDHYLARAYPFLKDSARYLEEIGGVNKIEFHLLEASPISEKRVGTLDKGVIFDLFCHSLALVGAVLNRNTTGSSGKLQAVKLQTVRAAKYAGCPISGETFAWIKFTVGSDIEVVSATGKCVGNSNEKFMHLYGAKGRIMLDFAEGRFSVFNSQGRQTNKDGELASEHVKRFLEGTLAGEKHPLSVPGVLSFEAALEILKILHEAKKQIDKMPEYPCHEFIDQILERLKERRLP